MPRLLLEPRPIAPPSTEAIRLRDLPNRRLRQIREQLGLSQLELAKLMRNAFPGWNRATVHAIETNQRRFHEDERLALAAFLMIPAESFLWPEDGETVEFVGKTLTASEARELLVGQDGKLGRGGPPWPTAARALGIREDMAPEPAERYARALRDASVQRQLGWILFHLPDGELDLDDADMYARPLEPSPDPHSSEDTLYVVRRDDGAQFCLHSIEGGAIRALLVDGAVHETRFVAGELVDDGVVPGGLPELN